MLKNIVGNWGSDLSDADYACALAALGTLEATGTARHSPTSDLATLAEALEKEFERGERTPAWRGAKNDGPACTPDDWHQTAHVDAAALAGAWRRYLGSIDHPRRAPRLALPLAWRARPDLFDFEALHGWLSHTDVALNGLVLVDGSDEPGRVAWHWPLRVGVPAGPAHAAILSGLRAAEGRKDWIRLLSERYAVGAGRDACDLLILAPGAARDLVVQPRLRMRASFVVCLDEQGLATADLDALSTLRHRLRAAGIAIIGDLDPSQMLGEWFEWLLREVSHDLPVHGAVSGVMRWRYGRDTLVLGNAPALDQCRIVAVAARQDRVLEELANQKAAAKGGGGPFMFGGPASGSAPAPAAPDLPPPNLADALRGRRFTAEDQDGVGAANEFSHRDADIDKARRPRWIQAQAWRGDEREMAARSLAPERWNLLAVHIGPSEKKLRGGVFPERRVDFRQGEVEVSVQLEFAGAAVTALAPDAGALRPADLRRAAGPVQELLGGRVAQLAAPDAPADGGKILGLAAAPIRLPPVGDSTVALFAVRPQAGSTSIEGRIAIIHNNRVLQTARLPVDVDTAADRGRGIEALPESTIHGRDDDLDDRREYDVAIQVSDVGGKLHLAIQSDGRATPVRLDDLAEPIAAIRKALERAAVDWDFTRPMLEQPVFGDTLYALAAHGSELQQQLRKACGNDIDGWQRIHLVPSTNEFLPLEYLYDGTPPSVDATACPNLLGALEQGRCERAMASPPDRSPCPNLKSSSFVCPMHFWGFRRLIERNGTVRPAAETPADAAAPLQVPSRQSYGKVGTLLFGASARAFSYAADPAAEAAERAELLESLGALTSHVVDAADWTAWRTAAASQPNLLFLVVHTDQVRGAPALEIGSGKFLGKQEIRPDLSGAAGNPQMLILLGCSAAGVTENFQPYPERFRDAGVSIVVAPVAPIRGQDAVKIGERLAKRLAERLAGPDPTSFGELLPALRRELLLEGHLGILGVVGFGDGDWLLGGQ